MKQERINYLIEKAQNHLKFLLEYKKNQAQVSTANSTISIPDSSVFIDFYDRFIEIIKAPKIQIEFKKNQAQVSTAHSTISIPYLSVIIDFYDRFIETMKAPKIQTYLKNLSELDKEMTAGLYKSLNKRFIWKTEASFESLDAFLQEALEIMQFSAVLCHHFYEATEDKREQNWTNNNNLINNLFYALQACGIAMTALAIIAHFVASPYLISALGIVLVAVAGILLITISHLTGKPSLPNDEDIYLELLPLKTFETIESVYPLIELKPGTGDLVASSNSVCIETTRIEKQGKKYVDVHDARTFFFQHGAKLQEDAPESSLKWLHKRDYSIKA